MNLPDINTVTDQDQARNIAIDWSNNTNEGTSWGELAEAQAYFEELATKFNLKEEFIENAII